MIFLWPIIAGVVGFCAGTTAGSLANNATTPPLVLENPTVNTKDSSIDVKTVLVYGAFMLVGYLAIKKLKKL